MQALRKILQTIVALVQRIHRQDMWGLAAQTTFFLMLSVYPLLLFFVSLMYQTGNELTNDTLHIVLPGDVASDIVEEITQASRLGGQWSLLAVIVSTWAASTGVWALMRGIHRAYHEKRMASPVRYRILALIFTFAFGIVMVISMFVLIFGRQAAQFISNQLGTENFAMTPGVRILVMLGVLSGFLTLLYRFTPGVGGKLRTHVLGAFIAAMAWIASAFVYEAYMNNFDPYSSIYGGIGAFLGLMVWVFILCLIVLAGAEINAYRRELTAKQRKNGVSL
ncbi:MAG: YihY/virulence factor BrkB family protein [Oscillospiraceae bacterium]|nr:YihY/virulence factor BrkB family protein [Oscillospiraceae bacterium]